VILTKKRRKKRAKTRFYAQKGKKLQNGIFKSWSRSVIP